MLNDEFFETVRGQPHSTVHSRVWDHPGVVIDIGCRGWDWSAAFIGKKRVLGVDPDKRVTAIPGTELHQSLIGAYDGVAAFRGETVVDADPNGAQAAIWSWKRFTRAAVDSRGVAVLKINIEASEYPLLSSLDADDFAQIDQIAVSFHHFAWPGLLKNTQAMIYLLESYGFTSKPLYPPLGWYLFH